MGMLLKWWLQIILAKDTTFPMVFNFLGLPKTPQYFWPVFETVAF